MDDNRIIDIWLGFGKIINLSTAAAAQTSAVQTAVTNTLRQFGRQDGDGADLYDDMLKVVVPLETRVQPTVAAMARIPSLAKATMEAYFRVLGDELGLPVNAQTSSILNAIRDDMAEQGETIYPSGALFNYFQATQGYSGFPTSLAPTIPDAWISSDVIIRPAPPSAPTFTSGQIEAAESGILVNWSDTDLGDTGVDRFRVNRAIGLGGAYVVIYTTPDAVTTGYLDTGVPTGQTAYYTIQAHNTGGGWSAPSVERFKISQGPH